MAPFLMLLAVTLGQAPNPAGPGPQAPAEEGKTDMMRTWMQGLYDATPFSIDAIGSEKDRPAWRARTLKDLRRALGLETFPEKTPLNARVVGTLKRDGYVVEKVVFETRPNFLMTANLYRPATVTGRVPAVLCVHGHSNAGKASGVVQTRSINYARAGWVVLAVDATGHGERVHIGHRRTWSIVTADLTVEGVQVWDNMRAIDYLLARPEVDPKRIGITGCSGGGNQTMYTAAVDDRIAVAAPVCSVSTLRGQIFTQNGIGCQCECIPDVMAYGLENAVVCALIAPRPLLVLAGSEDKTFPVVHTRVADQHLKRFYAAIGMPDRCRYAEKPVPHGYSKELRELSHAWFDRWFNARDALAEWSEPDTPNEQKEDLWCFPGGKLPEDSASLGSLAHDAARRLVGGLTVPRTEQARDELRKHIRDDVLGGFPKPLDPNAQASKPLTRDGEVHERVMLTSETGVTIQLKITRPAGTDAPCPVVARVRPRPTQERWDQATALLDMGLAVVELDARAMGKDGYISDAAIVLGRPLVGMVAFDITRMMDYLEGRKDLDTARTVLWADGPAALPALYAIALDRRIAGAALSGMLSTYVSPRPVQLPDWTMARGLLKYADIEHLVALAAPRPVLIANPVGPDLKLLDDADAAKAFPAARAAYGPNGRLTVMTGGNDAVLKALPRP